ncbi:hypothetical protein [uncultured Microbulbifer sp.]|uniref:hypothetical protein n=1 Tax=uncultured Microbulbifer sp. TaxID=348147 RepID=UPI0026243FAA|nr:hypothetical protein [uncultured Microbulbifer sp.]
MRRLDTGEDRNVLYWEPWKLTEKEQVRALVDALENGDLLVSHIAQVQQESQRLEALLSPNTSAAYLWSLQSQVLVLAKTNCALGGKWVKCDHAILLLEKINRRLVALVEQQAEKRPVFQRRAAHG